MGNSARPADASLRRLWRVREHVLEDSVRVDLLGFTFEIQEYAVA